VNFHIKALEETELLRIPLLGNSVNSANRDAIVTVVADVPRGDS
jgi:hypothetical protein